MAQAATILTCIVDLSVSKLPEVSCGFHHSLHSNACLVPKLGTRHAFELGSAAFHDIISPSLFANHLTI